jgi:threonine dehydrogenase-like Zn-dependent dehydrogenase
VHSDGGMRDTILLPAKQLYKCAKLTPAMIPLVETLAVGIHAVGRASVQPGERALVRGAGPIGLSVIEFLKVAGAEIGVVEKIPERLEFARKQHGLTRYYPSHDEALQDGSSTLVFDCTGDKGSMDTAIHLLEQGGRLVFVGLINDNISIFDPDIHRREATIFASRNSTPAEHRRTLELMESGQVDVSNWPTDIIAPTLMQKHFPKWLNREDGIVKGVVNWS